MNKQRHIFYSVNGFLSCHRFANNSSRAMKNDKVLSEEYPSFIACHLVAGNKK